MKELSVPLIETINLKKYFNTPQGPLHAVDDVSLKINHGQTFGVVGESGCGKSTLGRTILRLLEPTAGKVMYKGQNITDYTPSQMKSIRRKMQFIFQDPYSSLNPRMTVAEIISEPIKVTEILTDRVAINKRVSELMDTVGLAERLINTYPHELDGGRRQRVGVARALAVEPEFIVADEPVSALDVSIQAQILNLLMDLQDEAGFSYLFITHDLSVVKHISDEILVMYMGKSVEKAPTDALFSNPMHPYTQGLLGAILPPNLSSRDQETKILKGEVTSPINPKPGCRFAQRCSFVKDECMGADLELKEVAPNHFVACTLYN